MEEENSATENSRPSVSSSSTTPIDAPVETNCPAAAAGTMPPFPRASPASRYSGIGERPKRRASEPRMVRAVKMTPSSSSSAADTSTGSALVDDLAHSGYPLVGADHHKHVAGVQHLVGSG